MKWARKRIHFQERLVFKNLREDYQLFKEKNSPAPHNRTTNTLHLVNCSNGQLRISQSISSRIASEKTTGERQSSYKKDLRNHILFLEHKIFILAFHWRRKELLPKRNPSYLFQKNRRPFFNEINLQYKGFSQAGVL